jgi:hypothetical protein
VEGRRVGMVMRLRIPPVIAVKSLTQGEGENNKPFCRGCFPTSRSSHTLLQPYCEPTWCASLCLHGRQASCIQSGVQCPVGTLHAKIVSYSHELKTRFDRPKAAAFVICALGPSAVLDVLPMMRPFRPGLC